LIYQYRCRDCKEITEAIRKVEDRDEPVLCDGCGGDCRKIISLSRPHPDMQPYYDENLETHIESRQHREKVMKEKGVSEAYGKGWH